MKTAKQRVATWNDIEMALNDGTLEDKAKETLEAFNRVEPPPSKNPSFHARFADAKNRIRHRLSQIAEEEKAGATRSRSGAAPIANWFVEVNRSVRAIRKKALDAKSSKSKTAIAAIKSYMEADFEILSAAWPKNLAREDIGNLSRHINFSEPVDFRDILESDLPALEAAAEKYFLANQESVPPPEHGFMSLLHPVVLASSYTQFQQGLLRDAVLNSITGLCDHIRSVTGKNSDGTKLMDEIFGGDKPRLIFSEMDSESGKSDQQGFHLIFRGAWAGIRNPKAHSLVHDLTPMKAAQYLVFVSLLARRVDECKPAK